MDILLRVWQFQLYVCLARVYHAPSDTIQRPCIRVAWRDRLLFRIGLSPFSAGL